MLRRAIAAALVLAGVAIPGCAQRGAASRGGGFANRSAAPFRGNVSTAGRSSFLSAPRFAGNRYEGLNPRYFNSPRATLNSSHRYWDKDRGDRFRRPYISFYRSGIPYPAIGWIEPDYLGYSDFGWNDDAGYVDQPPSPYPDTQYEAPPPPPEQADAAPAPAFRPAYERPQPSTEPPSETPVTLVFKDGRPSEQIQNYMLTRTTLYVQQQQRMLQIPISQLDLAATEKVNNEAGVDFQLPGSPQ